jgi:hypothetical protein
MQPVATGPILRLADPPEAPPRLDPFGDEEGMLVKRSKLRGEPKMAWGYLRHRSGWGVDRDWSWGNKQFKVWAADVGEDQGTSSHSGTRCLTTLREERLIEVHDRCHVTGAWTITLLNPRTVFDPDFVGVEIVGVVAGDPQQQFSLDDEPSSESHGDGRGDASGSSSISDGGGVAEALADPPPLPSSDHRRSSVSASAIPSLIIGNPSDHQRGASTAKDQERAGPGGSAHGTARVAAEDDLSEADLAELVRRKRAAQQRELGLPNSEDAFDVNRTAAVAVALVRRLPNERSQSMLRERWINTIREAVNDDTLRISPIVRVACALVEGRITDKHVTYILAHIRKKRLAGAFGPGGASKYFCRSFQRLFAERGIEWKENPRAK